MSQGRKHDQPALFVTTTNIHWHIPRRHFYEQLGGLLDEDLAIWLRELTAPLYAAQLGRPSLDPFVFMKAMLVAFFENITDDVELEFRLADSLVLRKFLGYSLEERTPDESTLRKTRQRWPEEVFELFFERVLARCGERGLVSGRALGLDTTLIDANASMDSLTHRELGCTYEQWLMATRRAEQPSAGLDEAKAADRHRAGKASNEHWYSPSDAEAKVGKHADKHTHLSYRVDATVDLESGVIVSAGADYADQSDQETCLQRVDEATAKLAELGLQPSVIVGDKGHHSGDNLAGLEERGLVGLISSPRNERGAAGFRRSDFQREPESDRYVCPAGQVLYRVKTDAQGWRTYRTARGVCAGCAHFGVCTKSKRGRTVSLSPHEARVQANRERVHSEAARPLLMIRRQYGERPFGYFKRHGGLARVSGHGLDHAHKKVLLAATGYNLLLLVKQALRAGAAGGVAAWRRVRWAYRAWLGASLGPVGRRGRPQCRLWLRPA